MNADLENLILRFRNEELTLGQAADLAGTSQSEFLHQLGRRNICVHYDVPEFEEDLRTLEMIRRQEAEVGIPRSLS